MAILLPDFMERTTRLSSSLCFGYNPQISAPPSMTYPLSVTQHSIEKCPSFLDVCVVLLIMNGTRKRNIFKFSHGVKSIFLRAWICLHFVFIVTEIINMRIYMHRQRKKTTTRDAEANHSPFYNWRHSRRIKKAQMTQYKEKNLKFKSCKKFHLISGLDFILHAFLCICLYLTRYMPHRMSEIYFAATTNVRPSK